MTDGVDDLTPSGLTQERLEAQSLADLHALAHRLGIERYRRLRRLDLIERILEVHREGGEHAGQVVELAPLDSRESPVEPGGQSEAPPTGWQPEVVELTKSGEPERSPLEPVHEREEVRTGLLDIRAEGFGLLRVAGFGESKDDVYVSASQIRRFKLRPGDEVTGQVRPQRRTERHAALLHVDRVDGRSVDGGDGEIERPRFEDLVPVDPHESLRLDSDALNVTARAVDLLAPVARGQRLLVVSPPRAGATMALHSITRAVAAADPDCAIFVLLIEPRPEEVTEWERSIEQATVVACSPDQLPRRIVGTASLVLERAKRLCELGRHALVVVDSFTALANLHVLAEMAPGRDMNEVGLGAIREVKRHFCAARAMQAQDGGAGPLTIAGAEVSAGTNDFDLVLLEELGHVANAQLWLDREVAARGIYPAVEIMRTGTRNRHSFLGAADVPGRDKLRQDLLGREERVEQAKELLERLRSSISNAELLASL